MDKLVAIGKWLWYNKERFVLIVVMAVFCYRVYVVLNPPDPPDQAPPRPPINEVPEELKPPTPPPPPARSLPGNYSGLYNNNPFCYYCKARTADTNREVKPSDLGIKLLAIRKLNDGRVRAQLSTTTVPKRWYNEGEQFEEFELQEIDPDNNTVVIYSEHFARRFTLTMEAGGS